MHSLEFPPVVLRFAWMIFWSCGSGWIGRGGGKEASKMRKVNDASHVRINPPQGGSGRPEGNRPLPHDGAVILEYSPVFLCFRFCLTSFKIATLNPHAESVTDPLFQQNPFFDPRDLLQARYEMLRRHTADQMSILEAAAAFGVSRPTFYQAQASFQRSGLAGLLPARRGPKGGHKLTGEVLDYVATLRESEPQLTTVQCVQAIQERFAMTIHRRSLERALARRKKKPRGRT